MAHFYTADLHFGHTRISELSGRPFTSVDEMNETLISRWNARVTDDDTVHVLGDVALGQIDESLSYVSRLAGRKILIPGNHDRCWQYARPSKGRTPQEWTKIYLDAGFACVAQDTPPVMQILPDTETPVLLCHFPYKGDSRSEHPDRYVAQRPTDTGAWLLHGHTHGQWRQRARMIDVGVDSWGGAPVSAAEIAKLINAGPPPQGYDIMPLPWKTLTP